MTREDLAKAVTAIIGDILHNDDLVLSDDTSARDVPGWDSFNHIQIVVATEKKFGVRFKTSEIENLANFGEFITLLSAKAGVG